VRIARLLSRFVILAGLGLLASCDSQFGDAPTPTFVPNPEGNDKRIRQIANPASDDYAKSGGSVAVSGAVVVAVDTYDETHNGKSIGTIYVSDMGSQEPYSGISLFNPSWVPGNLRVGAGDALDLRGTYQENNTVPIQFAPKAYLVQIANPIGTFRFEASLPEPVVIEHIEDLMTSYEKGRPYLNMIVTVKNVTVQKDFFDDSGTATRLSSTLLPEQSFGKCSDPFPKAPAIVNELMDPSSLHIAAGTKLKSLTGIVTFFCNFHIAPRTPADIVVDK